jgi:hypothetical protein
MMVEIIQTRTFLDLLNLVESDLKKLLPNIKGALHQIKADFKVAESDSYILMNQCINDLDDFIGHLECLRTDRNSADDITISIPNELAAQAEVAAGDVQYALQNAASVLQGLEYAITDGSANSRDAFITAVMCLSSRALVDIARKEGETLSRVGSLILQEQGERQRANKSMEKAA